MSQLANYLPLKQGRDAVIVLTAEDAATGAALAVGWLPTDAARMQIREYLNGPVIGELTSERHIGIFAAAGPESAYITLSFYGEETITWRLSAAKELLPLEPIAETFVDGDLVLPGQKLYGTLFLTDQNDTDRPGSGADFAFLMEVSLTREAEVEVVVDDA